MKTKRVEANRIDILWDNKEVSKFFITGHKTGFHEGNIEGFIFLEGSKPIFIDESKICVIVKHAASGVFVEDKDA